MPVSDGGACRLYPSFLPVWDGGGFVLVLPVFSVHVCCGHCIFKLRFLVIALPWRPPLHSASCCCGILLTSVCCRR